MDDINFSYNKREIKLEFGREIIFRLSSDFKLDYINEYFTEFSGYEIHDVIGNSIESTKHRDIPEVISKLIDDHITKRENINLIIKNEVKDGRFYWYLTDFKFNINKKGELESVTYYRKSPPRAAIPALETLYKKLVDIEKHSSIEIAEKYLFGLLEEKGMSFEEYTAFLSQGFINSEAPKRNTAKQKKKKNIVNLLFKNRLIYLFIVLSIYIC